MSHNIFSLLGQAAEEQNIHLYQHVNPPEQQKLLIEQLIQKEPQPEYILYFGLL